MIYLLKITIILIKHISCIITYNLLIVVETGREKVIIRSASWVKVERADAILGGCGEIDPHGRLGVDG